MIRHSNIHHEAVESDVALGNSRPRVVVEEGDLGLGLFANCDIAEGEEILTFQGPLIDFEAAVAKGDKECWPLQVSPDEYMDLEQPGCFANHSCDPNAGIKILSLVALTDIRSGVEIRYDYSTTMDEDHFEMPCRCRSATCRTIVTDFKYLEAEDRRRYLRLELVQPFIAVQYDASSGQRIDVPSTDPTRRSRQKHRVLLAAG